MANGVQYVGASRQNRDVLNTINNSSEQGRDFWLEVDKGNIPGHSRFAFGGNILDLSSADGIRDIWNGAGNRTVLSSPAELYISSTDAGDNATIAVFGQDAGYLELVALATLDGQNQVQISADIWKTWSMFVLGTGNFNGAIYLAEADTLTDGVPNTDSKVQLVAPQIGTIGLGIGAICNRTIPLGHTFHVSSFTQTPNKGKDVTAYLAFQSDVQARVINSSSFELFQSGIQNMPKPTFQFGEKTDLMFLAKTNDTEAPISVLVEGVLIDNSI